MSGHSLVSLRDLILESQNGLSKRSGTDGVETPVLRLADISAGAIDESDPREIRLTAKELAKYALHPGDLVCIRVNGSKALVGRVIQFRANRVWAYCDHFIRLRPNQELVDHRYLAHYFNSQTVRRHIELNMVSSAGQNTVSQGTMLDIPVPCPAIETQRAIVAELEKQFSRLDEAVANLQRVKANLKRYKASVLKAAVEGRLVETEATLARREGRTYETGEQLLQRILEERRGKWAGKGKYKEPVVPVAPELSGLPEGWAIASYSQLGDVTTGFTPPTGDAANFGGSTPFFKPTDLDAGDSVRVAREYLSEAGLQKGRKLPAGSVLVTCIGATIGKTGLAQIDCATNQQINSVSPIDDCVDSRYLFWWTCSPAGQAQIVDNASATTLPILNKSKFEALPVVLPPLAEQARIVAEVDRHLSILREVEAEVDANLQRAQALRQSVLSKAFQAPQPNK